MNNKRSLSLILQILHEEQPNLATKLEWLKTYFKQQDQVIIAFSGGLDSGFLSAIAYQVLNKNAIAVTADTASLPRNELKEAKRVAKEIGIQHRIITYDELANVDLVQNPVERCYYCKLELATHLLELRKKYPNATIIEGTNPSELKGHRPGFQAIQEHKIETPLVDADLTKSEIRIIARIMGLSIHDKPSSACLNSRIPYNTPITIEKLNRIEKAEIILRKLIKIKQIRVREHENGTLARIEITPQDRENIFNIDLLDAIGIRLKELGYKHVSFDVEGYRTGSMN